MIQPYNHGTAAAITYAVARIASLAPNAVVGFFPSDHHFDCEDAFAAAANDAFLRAEGDASHIVLLGIVATSPESSYGWIEPGASLHRSGEPEVFGVRRFWEKPGKQTAQRVFEAGCLWNSFVMVGRVSAFLTLLRSTVPDLLARFESLEGTVETGNEDSVLRKVFSKIPARSFSDDVLSSCPSALAVLPVHGTGWTDLGDPERVQATLGIVRSSRSGLMDSSRQTG